MKFFIALSFILILLSGCTNKENTNINKVESNTTSSANYNTQVSRTSTAENEQTQTTKQEKETEIASYTTPILITDPERQNNVRVACSELNGTLVNSGDTFSFTSTLGPATPEKGYEKADTFEGDGDIVQEYGGGKCQISSTLYNAVLKVPELVVVERHEHSRDVDYVPEGQDAAISYGSVDFKFRNDTSNNIKIYATCTEEEITISISKIYYE